MHIFLRHTLKNMRTIRLSSIIMMPCLIILSGCSSGKLSAREGDLRFCIPFDFPQSDIEEVRQKKISDELLRLEKQEANECVPTLEEKHE